MDMNTIAKLVTRMCELIPDALFAGAAAESVDDGKTVIIRIALHHDPQEEGGLDYPTIVNGVSDSATEFPAAVQDEVSAIIARAQHADPSP